MGLAVNRVRSIKALGKWLNAATVILLMVPCATNLAFSSTSQISGSDNSVESAKELLGSQSVREYKTELSTRKGIAMWAWAVGLLQTGGVGRKVPLDIWGARRVLNFRGVRPDGAPSPIATGHRADQEVDTTSYLSGPDIEVKVQGGAVIVGGTMDTQWEKLRIGDLASVVRKMLNFLQGLAVPCPTKASTTCPTAHWH